MPRLRRFHCPFVGLSGCKDGNGNGLTKASLRVHLRTHHFCDEARVLTRQSLSSLAVFSNAEATFRQMGIWLCGVCLKTPANCSKCEHDDGSVVPPPDRGDGVVQFTLYSFPRPAAPSPSVVVEAEGDFMGGLNVALLDRLMSKGLRTVKSIPPKCRLSFSRIFMGALDAVIRSPDDLSCWVSLLILPICILRTFTPRSNLECRSSVRRQRQEESIVSAIATWVMPGGILQLVQDTLAEASPSFGIDEDLPLCEGNIRQARRKICDGHYTAAVRVLSSSGVAPYSEATLLDLQAKHPFVPPPIVPQLTQDQPPLFASSALVLDMIRSFPRGTSCGRDGLRAQHLMDCLGGAAVAVSDGLVASIAGVANLFLEGRCPGVLGEYIASAPLTPLLKPGGGIRPIAVGMVWRRLVSKIGASLVGPSLCSYFDGLQFGVGVSGGGEAILHALNRFIEDRGDQVGLSMLMVDFQNAFNLVDRGIMLQEVRRRCPVLSRWVEFCYSSPARLYYGDHRLSSCQGVQQGDPLGPLLFALVLHPLVCKIRDSFDLDLQAWYLDDGTIVGDTLVVGKVLELIMEEGPLSGLHLNVAKTEVFWPREDPRSLLPGVFPSDISRPTRGVKVLGGPVSLCSDFCSELVSKRVSRTIELMDSVAQIDDPQCELLLLRACTGISKLYFALRTCSPSSFGSARLSFDAALRSSLERIVTASGPDFGDWQWRLATFPFQFGGLGVYAASDVLHYAFVASRLQSAELQAKLLRVTGISSPGPTLDAAVCEFNLVTGSDFLGDLSGIAAPKLMKKLADIYFTKIASSAESVYSLTPRHVALWKSQQGDHTSDWLRAVPIPGLGQTMNGRTYRCVLSYRLGIPLFRMPTPCSACSRVSDGDIFGDHAVSCMGIVGVKHRHNLVRDTLLDICTRSGISAGKEVDIGLIDEHGKPLRPADLLLYAWDQGTDVCVDLTGSSPLTASALSSFAPGQAVIDAARLKRAKYQTFCSGAGYGFLPFSFSTLGELDKDAAALLSRIRKYSLAHDAGARAAAFIFTRLSFAVAKGVGAQLVSRLPTNFL